MKLRRTQYALMIALAGTVALAGCKKEEPVVAPPVASEPVIDPAPLETAPAVSTTSVTVGNSAAADKTVLATSTFAPTDKIIVSVGTQAEAANATIDAKLTYQDGQVAGQKSETVVASGAGITNVEFSNANPWPAGKYTVDVTVNGQPAGIAQQIEVR